MKDDNGLLYLRARYYNPTIGQFFSLDPLEGVMEQPMSLNRYMYVQGNVSNRVDPSGMIAHEDLRTLGRWNSCNAQQKSKCDCLKPIPGDLNDTGLAYAQCLAGNPIFANICDKSPSTPIDPAICRSNCQLFCRGFSIPWLCELLYCSQCEPEKPVAPPLMPGFSLFELPGTGCSDPDKVHFINVSINGAGMVIGTFEGYYKSTLAPYIDTVELGHCAIRAGCNYESDIYWAIPPDVIVKKAMIAAEGDMDPAVEANAQGIECYHTAQYRN